MILFVFVKRGRNIIYKYSINVLLYDFSLFCLSATHTYVRPFAIVLQCTETVYSFLSIFFLIFRLDVFHWSIFKFMPFSITLNIPLSSSSECFYFRYCIFQSENIYFIIVPISLSEFPICSFIISMSYFMYLNVNYNFFFWDRVLLHFLGYPQIPMILLLQPPKYLGLSYTVSRL